MHVLIKPEDAVEKQVLTRIRRELREEDAEEGIEKGKSRKGSGSRKDFEQGEKHWPLTERNRDFYR